MSRVVLVIPRRGIGANTRLEYALEQIERGGHELAAVVDPEQHLDALRMVLDGLADVVAVTSPEHFPAVVQHVADLNGTDERRSRPILRPAEGRRPRIVAKEPMRRSDPVERRPAVLPRGERTQMIRRTA